MSSMKYAKWVVLAVAVIVLSVIGIGVYLLMQSKLMSH